MNNKVTYLIGAGASYNAHPIAKTANDFSNYSKNLHQFVIDNKEVISRHIGATHLSEHIFKTAFDITNMCIKFGTPDTYAKWLFEHSKIDEYKKLKKIISSYFRYKEFNPFNVENLVKEREYRVLPFLTSIMNDGKLPSNIKVLSWNYDNQFEIAASNRILEDVLLDSKSIKYIKGFSCWPNLENSSQIDFSTETPFLLHLNGLSGFNYSKVNLAEGDIPPFLDLFSESEPLLSYAWEDDQVDMKTFTTNRLNNALRMIDGTDYLVIIGYSFPFFNRKIDKDILNTICKTVNKIYFQEPNLEVSEQDLINKFNLQISQDRIQMIRSRDQYHIPHEL